MLQLSVLQWHNAAVTVTLILPANFYRCHCSGFFIPANKKSSEDRSWQHLTAACLQQAVCCPLVIRHCSVFVTCDRHLACWQFSYSSNKCSHGVSVFRLRLWKLFPSFANTGKGWRMAALLFMTVSTDLPCVCVFIKNVKQTDEIPALLNCPSLFNVGVTSLKMAVKCETV